MSLVVDYSDADGDQILVCHIRHWRKMDVYASNSAALGNIRDNKYKSTKLVGLGANSDEVFKTLDGEVNRGNSVTVSFNVYQRSATALLYGGRASNEFVPITRKQFRDLVPNQTLIR
jgi:hypothetical protein